MLEPSAVAGTEGDVGSPASRLWESLLGSFSASIGAGEEAVRRLQIGPARGWARFLRARVWVHGKLHATGSVALAGAATVLGRRLEFMNAGERGNELLSNDGVLRDLVGSSAEAAYVTGPNGIVVAWNAAAARLLGYDERQAVGSHCWQLLRGTDVHGNAHCGPRCPVVEMVRRGEPVHDFALSLGSATGGVVCVRVTVVGVRLPCGDRAVLHLLHPCLCQEPTVGQVGDRNDHDDAECRPGPVPGGPPLSARELEVLRLLRDGAPTFQIASFLFISPFTVRTHIQRILSKLGAHSKLEAVAVARRTGLL